MKKFFTLCAVALCAMTVNAQAFYSWEDGMQKVNSVTNEAGYTLAITGNTTKTLSNGNASFVIDGTTYKTVKLSNGAENTLTAPSGTTFRYVTLYSYLNCSADKLKTKDGNPYIRDSYWANVNGKDYSYEETPLKVINLSADELATVSNGNNFKSTADDGTVFDVYTFDLGANVSSFTFKNTGEQPGVVIEVSNEPVTTPTGIAKVLAGAKVINENAPAYNLSGQRVGKGYKGLVVKDGHKFFNK